MSFENIINTIQLGNSYELIKDIPDKSIDLIIIDPPYEYTTGGGGGCFGTKNKKHHKEYLKVSVNTNTQKYIEKGLNEGQARVWADKEKSREEIKHISTGFDYSLLDELDRIMSRIYIYIYTISNRIFNY